jgi:hypothetical protein
MRPESGCFTEVEQDRYNVIVILKDKHPFRMDMYIVHVMHTNLFFHRWNSPSKIQRSRDFYDLGRLFPQPWSSHQSPNIEAINPILKLGLRPDTLVLSTLISAILGLNDDLS